jgi:hypothetical protein
VKVAKKLGSFTPVDITISMETEEEFKLLRALFAWHVTIPKTIFNENTEPTKCHKLDGLMRQVHSTITSRELDD